MWPVARTPRSCAPLRHWESGSHAILKENIFLRQRIWSMVSFRRTASFLHLIQLMCMEVGRPPTLLFTPRSTLLGTECHTVVSFRWVPRICFLPEDASRPIQTRPAQSVSCLL